MKKQYFKNEDEIISCLKKWLGSPKAPWGIGDDAALLGRTHNLTEVLTTDFLVEGIDFTSRDDLERVGRKVLAVNLSDLAAMGAKPRSALLYLGLPSNVSRSDLKRFAQGWKRLAKKYAVSCIGGDLSRSRHWIVGAVVRGETDKPSRFLRSGAEVRDSVWVTGKLGGSRLGHQFDFEPRLREAQFLNRHFPVSACIDLSDGLSQDLPRLLKASRKGVRLSLDQIPISRAAHLRAKKTRKTPLTHALNDGEDFELLFTLGSRYDKSLARAWKRKFKTPLTKIGTIREKGFDGGKFLNKGFDHFKKQG